MKRKIGCIWLAGMLLLLLLRVNGQSREELQQISASQSGSSPLYFTPERGDARDVRPELFHQAKECTVRGGLNHFFAKIKEGKSLTVGFIGGSITQSPYGYRMQTAAYLQTAYPGAHFEWLNAGVSGTGTELGACRIGEQLLRHHPDLIFIEFAVNGAYAPGMEGMVRQIIKNDPKTDVCLIYTALKEQVTAYQKDSVTANIRRLEQVADRYRLPSIHLAMEAAKLEKKGSLIWKGIATEAGDKLLFSADGIHPLPAGGNLYAAAIARGIKKMEMTQTEAALHVLPPVLFFNQWEKANMVEPLRLMADSNWKIMKTAEHGFLKQFSGWFPYILSSEKANSMIRFRFEGTAFGIFDIGGPEAGQLCITVDGHAVRLQRKSAEGYTAYQADDVKGDPVLNRFNNFCNNRYRGQYDFIELGSGQHTVSLTISSEKADKKEILGVSQWQDIEAHPEKYNRTAIYLGKILLKGKLIN